MNIPADTFLPEELAELEAATAAALVNLFSVRRRRPTADGYGSSAQSMVAVGFVAGSVVRMAGTREVVRGGVLQPVSRFRLQLARTIDVQAHDMLRQWGVYRVELGKPTSGTWTLGFGAETTAAISYAATPAQVKAALELLVGIGTGGAEVSGLAGQGHLIELAGALRQSETQLTAASVDLVGAELAVNQTEFEVLDVDWGLADATVLTAECVRLWQ